MCYVAKWIDLKFKLKNKAYKERNIKFYFCVTYSLKNMKRHRDILEKKGHSTRMVKWIYNKNK